MVIYCYVLLVIILCAELTEHTLCLSTLCVPVPDASRLR
jgi:hypothetical protein